ncbi:MAG: CinA family protein [Gammaproteobacteria bacterium]|nr:CinA family protein [Gammaproteobacteria bacterium]
MQLLTLGQAVGALLKERRQTIAVSESSAGGLISAALLSVPGASSYFLGGGVVYTGPARAHVLGLPAELPSDIRSSSEPYAQLCARTIREKLGTDWGLAETGAAGPTGNRYGDDAGHSCVAIAGPAEAVLTVETRSADREANMWAFTRAALELLERHLRG